MLRGILIPVLLYTSRVLSQHVACTHICSAWVPWTNWGHGCQGAPLLLFSSLHNVELSVHEQYQHISLPGQRECRKPEEPMENTAAPTIKEEDHFLPSPLTPSHDFRLQNQHIQSHAQWHVHQDLLWGGIQWEDESQQKSQVVISACFQKLEVIWISSTYSGLK